MSSFYLSREILLYFKFLAILSEKLNQNIINADWTKENVDKLRQQYENAVDSWTNECTKWYDIYLDEMYPESDF